MAHRVAQSGAKPNILQRQRFSPIWLRATPLINWKTIRRIRLVRLLTQKIQALFLALSMPKRPKYRIS